MLGVIYKRYEGKICLLSAKKMNAFLLTCVVIFIVSGLFFPSALTFYNYDNTLLSGGMISLLIKLMRIIVYFAALVSAFVILLFLYNHRKFIFCEYMINIGKQTLTIYVLHLILLVDIIKPLMNYYGYGSVLPHDPFLRFYFLSVFETILLVFFTYIIASYMSKIRFLKILFMGGRS